jgi:hypothetical protein
MTDPMGLRMWANRVRTLTAIMPLQRAVSNTLDEIEALIELGVTRTRMAKELADVGVVNRSGEKISADYLRRMIHVARSRRNSAASQGFVQSSKHQQSGGTQAANLSASSGREKPGAWRAQGQSPGSGKTPPGTNDPYKEKRRALFGTPHSKDNSDDDADDDLPRAEDMFRLKPKGEDE